MVSNLLKLFYPFNRNNKGFTITEVLVGSGILAIVVIGGLTAFDHLGRLTNTSALSSTLDDRVNEIIENIRQQPTTQILQYDEPSNLLKTDTLKMAWSNNVNLPVSECPECPGRYGYVITPATKATTDLYLVTIIFTHAEWGKDIKKFEFLVSK